MSKIELPTVTSGYNLSAINNNFQKIEDTLNKEVLYRKGYLGEPNEMQTNLDMNGKQILNVTTGTSDGSLVSKGYVDQGLALKFDKSGGPLSGSVDMGNNEIINTSRLSTDTLEIGGVPVVPTDLAIYYYNETREALRRSYAEAGYNLVDGSFEAGGTLVNVNDVLLQERTGKAFSGPAGTVTPGTNPVGDANWKPVTDELLRGQLASSSGSNMVGHGVDTVAEVLSSLQVTGAGVRTAWVSTFGLSDTDAQFNAIQLDAKLRELQGNFDTIIIDKSYNFDTGYNPANGSFARRVSRITEFKWVENGGELTGLYDIPVQPRFDVIYRPENNSNIAISGKFKTDTLTVLIMGDSISTDMANSISYGATQWELIKAEFVRQNPGKTINFLNRAIGGQTWLEANGKPTYFPYWYTDQTKDWVYYVVGAGPDVVLFAFGMNDGPSFNMGTMVETITRVKTGLPNAHLMMVTCMAPSRSSDYNGGFGYDGDLFNGGRNFAAGAERTYADYLGMSVIDINRAESAWRDSRDIVSGELVETPVSLVNGVFTGPPCIDFSAEVQLPAGWNGSTPLYIQIGRDDPDLVFIGGGGAGNANFAVTASVEYIGGYFGVADTTVPIPTGSFWLVVSVINNRCNIWASLGPGPIDHLDTSWLLASFNVIRHGGSFTPRIGNGGPWTSGPLLSARAMVGAPKRVVKELTDTDIWGLGNADAATKQPSGGNGLNHPSTVGLERLVKPVLEAQNLTIKLLPFTEAPILASGVTAWAGGQPPVVTYDVDSGSVIFTGSLKGVGAPPSLAFTLQSYSRLGATQDKFFSAFGLGSLWDGALMTVHPDGRVELSLGSMVNGGVLSGAQVRPK